MIEEIKLESLSLDTLATDMTTNSLGPISMRSIPLTVQGAHHGNTGLATSLLLPHLSTWHYQLEHNAFKVYGNVIYYV